MFVTKNIERMSSNETINKIENASVWAIIIFGMDIFDGFSKSDRVDSVD